jgi:hypothetical protein
MFYGIKVLSLAAIQRRRRNLPAGRQGSPLDEKVFTFFCFHQKKSNIEKSPLYEIC